MTLLLANQIIADIFRANGNSGNRLIIEHYKYSRMNMVKYSQLTFSCILIKA